MAQVDLKMIRSIFESLVVEFGQEKFEQFLSPGFVSPKSMLKYGKVSKETCSLSSSEVSQGKVSSEANCIHSSTSLEIHATSLEANSTCESLRRPARPMLWLKANIMTEINLVIKPLTRLIKLELTAFTVERPLLQVTKTQVLRFR